jgi:hypothetical protein
MVFIERRRSARAPIEFRITLDAAIREIYPEHRGVIVHHRADVFRRAPILAINHPFGT